MSILLQRRVWMLGLLAAVLTGCASEYRLPPNSVPLSRVQDGQFPNYSKILPGTWTLVSEVDTAVDVSVLPNVIDRQAELAGIKGWKTFEFTSDGKLTLRNGNTTEVLVWAVERNQLTLHLRGGTEPDRWQINLAGGSLFLRSLTDSDAFTLKKNAVSD